jgi:UDP-GlcNAc3NAcA epimerase
MKIVTVIGARPQFIKAAALSRTLAEHGGVEEVIVHTGQHFDANMSEVFFTEMEIPTPKYNLAIHSVGHGAMTGRMLEGIEQLLLDEQPDMLLVYGDTNSTIAGALAAKKLHIPVGHVEAGLRSFNMRMPEEVNRILTDRISDLLFCPTDTAVNNLMNEGYEHLDAQVLRTGDVMQDAALYYAQFSEEKATAFKDLALSDGFVLSTIHRAENTDDPKRLKGIIQALNTLHEQHEVVCPLHPRTRNILAKQDTEVRFRVIDPVGYFDMIELLKHASLVLTDSGGLQKEAFFFQNPCVTMRDETEWVELVEHGFNAVVGADTERILSAATDMRARSASLDFSIDLYGQGKATQYITNAIVSME